MSFWRALADKLDGWTTYGGSAVAEEAAAYLQGRLLERQRDAGAGGRVPAWLWLNAVAHGDAARLHELAEPPRPGPSPVAGWRSARAVLAHEALQRCGDDPAALRNLQLRALVPLEAGLADIRGLTPAKLHEIAVQEMWLIES